MGEYAKYRKTEIKIGTCEAMLYLRWDQRHQVEAMTGNVDPIKDIKDIWFRLPRVLEFTQAPGDFPFLGFNGARPIPIYIRSKTQLESDVQELLRDESHLGYIQIRSDEAGILFSAPCNHGTLVKRLPERMGYNGFNPNTLCITAVGVRLSANPEPNPDKPLIWQAFALVACRICGRTLFRFSRQELEQCQVLSVNTGAELSEDIIDFHMLPSYMEKMEQDAEAEFPVLE